MNFKIVSLLIICCFVVLFLLFLFFKAMQSRYSVKIDFKFPACRFKFDIKPSEVCKDRTNEISTSRSDHEKK